MTPKFVPVGPRPTSNVMQAGYTQPLLPAGPAEQARRPAGSAEQSRKFCRQLVPDDIADLNLRTDLPGSQRLFMRESESNFYERIRQDAKRHPAGR